MRVRVFLLSVTILLAATAAVSSVVVNQRSDAYDIAALERFRAEREKALLADDGWLTVAGLHFLNQGENRIGADPTNDIVLDYPSIPAHAAVITLEGRQVTIRAAGEQPLRINGRELRESELHGPFDGRERDEVQFGPVTFFVHYSGPRLALRVRDRNSPLRKNFHGLRWYEPNPAYRTVGTFTPYREPKVVEVPNILGDVEPFTAVGTVTFEMGGRTHTVEAWGSVKRLWIVFRDRTSGRETYPSARFLYTPPVEDGRVVIDFNYAQNPPCAYNPYTTCPLPPPQNRLPVAIEAGEKIYAVDPT